MTNDERRNNDQARMADRHPERSEAESKDPVELLFGFATGFLDFARNDSHFSRHPIIRASFNIRHSCFVIFSAPASLRRDHLEFLAENAMAAGIHRRSRRLGACADR